jgi:hypothetical protein
VLALCVRKKATTASADVGINPYSSNYLCVVECIKITTLKNKI